MKELWMTVGLPRSGKSTWSRQQGHPMVNPDSIRDALYGGGWKPEGEKMVWALAHYMVRALFHAGHNVVILDACSMRESRREEWISAHWQIRIHEVHTNVDLCKERAVATGMPDLLPVIDRMIVDYEPVSLHWATV